MKTIRTDLPDSADELDSIRRVLDGDVQVYADLVNAHKGQVFAMIMRQVGDEQLAEELSQETFFKAFRGLASFKGKSAFSTWLIRIALNESKTYFASKRFKERLLSAPLIIEPKASEADVLERERQLAQLRYAIGTLKPKLRDVVTLHSLEGKSYAEVAAILNIPIGTVGSRMNQAVKHLRNKMERLSNER